MIMNEHEQVIQVIKKRPDERTNDEIVAVLPWLRKASSIFREIDKNVLQTIVKYCSYTTSNVNDIIIRQGDIGDRLYIILSGSVSIYVSIDRKRSSFNDEDESTSASLTDNVTADEMDVTPSVPLSTVNNELQPIDKNNDKDNNTDVFASRPSTSFGSNSLRSESAAAFALEEESDSQVIEFATITDRENLGNLVVQFGAGKSFGELALIQEDCVRNASVVSDDFCELLVLSRNVYNSTLKVSQQREYNAKKQFVQQCPLFQGWSKRMKHQLAISLVRETYPYSSTVYRQSEPCPGLMFILRGKLLISTEPAKHAQQYPHLEPFMVDPALQELRQLMGEHWGREPAVCIEEQPRQKLVHMRRSLGYNAVEQYLREKCVPLAVVTDGGIIGDVELMGNLSTNLGTAWCATDTELFLLTNKNFERLSIRKNLGTMHSIRQLSDMKLRARLRVTNAGEEVPFLKGILAFLNAIPRPPPKPLPPLAGTKTLPDDDVLFQHLIDTFSRNKAELIEPCVRGGIYFREMMRERVAIRERARKVRATKGRAGVKNEEAERAQKQRRAARALIIKPKSDRARTMKELQTAIEKFKVDHEREEELKVIKKYRDQEEQELRTIYNIMVENLAREAAAKAAELEALKQQQEQEQQAKDFSETNQPSDKIPSAILKKRPIQVTRNSLKSGLNSNAQVTGISDKMTPTMKADRNLSGTNKNVAVTGAQLVITRTSSVKNARSQEKETADVTKETEKANKATSGSRDSVTNNLQLNLTKKKKVPTATLR